MSAIFIPLILQLVGGVAGGSAFGRLAGPLTLGARGNTLAGAVGGIGGGHILPMLLPALAAASGDGLEVEAIVSQLVSAGAGGALLAALLGIMKDMLTGKPV